MNEITSVIKGVVCYFDDILCHSATTEEHGLLLTQLKRFQDIGLQLNSDKCEYYTSEIHFLGHIINKDGVKPDLPKVAAIVQMPQPTDVSELKRYLGMVNYLGRYLPNQSRARARACVCVCVCVCVCCLFVVDFYWCFWGKGWGMYFIILFWFLCIKKQFLNSFLFKLSFVVTIIVSQCICLSVCLPVSWVYCYLLLLLLIMSLLQPYVN